MHTHTVCPKLAGGQAAWGRLNVSDAVVVVADADASDAVCPKAHSLGCGQHQCPLHRWLLWSRGLLPLLLLLLLLLLLCATL